MAGVCGTVAQCDRQGRDQGTHPAQESRTGRVVVSLVVFRRRLLDDDNLIGGLKWLRDAIAGSLGIDDGDERIRFEYAQVKTSGREGTVVKIQEG